MTRTSGLFARAIRSLLGALTLLGCLPAGAADFSFTGNFLVGRQVQFFDFTLVAPAVVNIRTFHYGGGVNAAGASIPGGGFDPQLFLFALPTGALLTSNDDSFSFDSALTGVNLAAGAYRLALTKFNNDSAANLSGGFNSNTSDGFGARTTFWAVDIRNVTSAAVVAPVTQGNLACLAANISALTGGQVTGPAQRNLLLGYVGISSTYLGSIYDSLSMTSLRALITRANGCGERATPDGISSGGTEIDFVTSCPAQEAVLACLRTPTQGMQMGGA